MISYNVDKEKELLDLFARRWKAKRLLLRSEEWKVVLEWMKEFFQTDLPCFQKQEGERLFDPLDAMRRDAHREVVLWLEMLPKDKGREEGE